MISTAKINIEEVINTELPASPAIAMRVAALTRDLNASTRAIADAIGSDPLLAARVISAANASSHALERRVSALPPAVSAHGNQMIYTLAVSSGVSESRWLEHQTPITGALHQHSLAVGMAARQVVRELGMNGDEEAFACGLLHDIGKLLMAGHDANLYAHCANYVDEQQLFEREREIYGFTHAQAGALVAKRWNFPDELCYAIYNHHHPGQAKNSLVIARVVDIDDNLANAHGYGLRLNPQPNLATTESALALRLTAEQLNRIWDAVEPELTREMIALASSNFNPQIYS